MITSCWNESVYDALYAYCQQTTEQDIAKLGPDEIGPRRKHIMTYEVKPL